MSYLKTLDTELVKNMLQNYQKTLQSNDETTSVWLNLSKLKDFIQMIEKEVQQKDTNISPKDLGLQIFFSKYPDFNDSSSDQFKDLDVLKNHKRGKNYGNKNTIVGIPTLNINGVPKNFDPTDKSTYKEGFDMNSPSEMSKCATLNSKNRSSAMNHGTLIPPPISEVHDL